MDRPPTRMTPAGYERWYRDKGYGLNESVRAAKFEGVEDRIADIDDVHDLKVCILELLELIKP